MSNPLVAQRQDSTTSLSGVPILESVDETRKAVESGDWAAGVMGAVGTGLDALGMALDPFGAILAAGVGWLMEHVGPVSDALDALTGDPDEIKAHSETWKNVAAELDAVRTEMTDVVKSDTASWTGQAGDAYRARSEDIGALIEAAKSAAQGAADGIATAGEVVGAVRTLVRDIIAELVGHLVSWALQVLATLGVGMTWVVPQVVAEVAKVAARIADITSKLVRAFKVLTPLLKKLGKGFGDAGDKLRKIKADGSSAGPGKTPPPPKTGNGDAPATPRRRPGRRARTGRAVTVPRPPAPRTTTPGAAPGRTGRAGSTTTPRAVTAPPPARSGAEAAVTARPAPGPPAATARCAIRSRTGAHRTSSAARRIRSTSPPGRWCSARSTPNSSAPFRWWSNARTSPRSAPVAGSAGAGRRCWTNGSRSTRPE
ncbi:hypothetical protein GCM10020366_42800 [Saccharopolyspora gregorii]|uniref:Outer membrane channel protein CpnT-like N-terminal domain-containing protein n=1 Tax=Saccharopolyspora gregorii TaxID=33914 RepID=A0ABP6RSV7_9PSEU